MWNILIPSALLVVLLALGARWRLQKFLDPIIAQQGQQAPEPDANATYSVAIDPLDPQIGPKDAPVTIVEAMEFG